MVFATCEPKRALSFINYMYPDYQDFTKDDIPILYDLISKDILRVQDPEFHQPCQIIAGNKYNSEYDNDISEAIDELKSNLRKVDQR